MSRAGVLASSRREAEPEVGTRLVSTGKDENSAFTFTFPGLALGEPDPSRLIVVCFGSRGGFTTETVTVAGVAATFLVHAMVTDYVATWVAAVPEGETGDVVVDLTVEAMRGMVAVYALYGMDPTPLDVFNGNGTVATAPGGFAVGNSILYLSSGNPRLCTWTGMTQDHADLADGIINFSTASADTEAESLTYSASWNGGTGVRCVAAFAPLP